MAVDHLHCQFEVQILRTPPRLLVEKGQCWIVGSYGNSCIIDCIRHRHLVNALASASRFTAWPPTRSYTPDIYKDTPKAEEKDFHWLRLIPIAVKKIPLPTRALKERQTPVSSANSCGPRDLLRSWQSEEPPEKQSSSEAF